MISTLIADARIITSASYCYKNIPISFYSRFSNNHRLSISDNMQYSLIMHLANHDDNKHRPQNAPSPTVCVAEINKYKKGTSFIKYISAPNYQQQILQMIMCETNKHYSIHENQTDKIKDQSKTMRGNNTHWGMDSITYPLMAYM